jgi:peptide/nickel transport system permease protein
VITALLHLRRLRVRRRDLLLLFTLAMCGVILGIAILAPFIAPYDPLAIDFADRFAPPSTKHFFGADSFGRDLFSRVIHGSRISLRVGFFVLGIAMTIGGIIGTVSGFYGGWLDSLLMRMTDIFFAFPFLILAMAIAASLGPGINNAIIALAAVWWTPYARLFRGQVLSMREKEFVEAATALGMSELRVMFRHILPNCFGPIFARATTDLGYIILAGATLGFVGLGAQPPIPEWGTLISEGRLYLMTSWWLSMFPGVAIFFTVIGFSLLGDELHRRFIHAR